MKTSFFFLAIYFTCSTVCAQGISEDFETWITNPGGFHVPEGWTVNNANPSHPVSLRSENAYSGSYALQLFSEGASFEGDAPGWASRTFYATNNNPISIYVKVDSILVGGSAIVRVWTDNYASILGSWTSTTVTSGYISVTVPIPGFQAPDSLIVQLISSTTQGPLGYDGYAIVSFDAIGQATTAANEPGQNAGPTLYPNPTSGIVYFKNGETAEQVVIADVQGRVLKTHFNVREIDLSTCEKGVYFIHTLYKGHWFAEKVVLN